MKQCPLQAKRQLYKCNGMETRPADTGAHGQRHKKALVRGHVRPRDMFHLQSGQQLPLQ